jgi:hypothetical protein
MIIVSSHLLLPSIVNLLRLALTGFFLPILPLYENGKQPAARLLLLSSLAHRSAVTWP